MAAHPRDWWVARFESVDACVTPVLTFAEAAGAGSLEWAAGATAVTAPRTRAAAAAMGVCSLMEGDSAASRAALASRPR